MDSSIRTSALIVPMHAQAHTCACTHMCTSILSHKWKHAFCSRCCWSSTQISCTASAPTPSCWGCWLIMAHSSPLLQRTLIATIQSGGTLQPTQGYKMMDDSVVQFTLQSCQWDQTKANVHWDHPLASSSLSPLLLGAISPKSTGTPVSVFASRSTDVRHLTIPYLHFSTYWFLGKDSISRHMELLHSFNSLNSSIKCIYHH